jgi:hypothetical protein
VGSIPIVRGSAQFANVTDVFSTELEIRISFVKTSEFRGRGEEFEPPNRYATGHTLKRHAVPNHTTIRAEQKLWEVRFYSDSSATKAGALRPLKRKKRRGNKRKEITITVKE